MGKIIETIKRANYFDDVLIKLDDPKIKGTNNAIGNKFGRKFIIGNISGAIRTIGGLVKGIFTAIGALFALIAAGVTRPCSKRISAKCLNKAKICGDHTLDAIKSIARGVVEMLPGTAYFLAKYDISQLDDEFIAKYDNVEGSAQ